MKINGDKLRKLLHPEDYDFRKWHRLEQRFQWLPEAKPQYSAFLHKIKKK